MGFVSIVGLQLLVLPNVCADVGLLVETPTSGIVGQTPAEVSFAGNLPGGLNANGVITIQATHDVWKNAGATISGAGAYSIFSDGTELTSNFVVVAQTRKILKVTADGTVSIAAGAGIDINILAASNEIGPFTSVGDAVAFVAYSTSDPTSVAVTGGWTVSAATAASDPVTFWNDERIQFWLPLRTLLPLLETPDLRIFASVFQGPTVDHQWFDRFVLRLPNGETFAQVGLKGQLPGSNRSLQRRGGLRQFDLTLGENPTPLSDPPPMYFAIPGTSIRIAVETRLFNPPRLHGSPLMEYVHVESDTISFIVQATHAGIDFPHDLNMQSAYAHLDWTALDMRGVESFTGILAELWGLAPLTETVASMRTPPSQALSALSCPGLSCAQRV